MVKSAQVGLVGNEWTYDGIKTMPKRKPSPSGKKFLEAFFNCPTETHEGRQCVTRDAWWAECAKKGLIDPHTKEHSARTLFAKHRRELITCNLVACGGDLSWRV